MSEHACLFVEKFKIAWITCFILLIHGQIDQVSGNHAITAAYTAGIAGLSAVGASILGFFTFGKNVFLEAWMTGILIMMADFISHPTSFGTNPWTESMLVGLLGGVLFIAYTTIDRAIFRNK